MLPIHRIVGRLIAIALVILLVPATVLAQEVVALEEEGLRYYPAGAGECVLTPDNLAEHPQELLSMGTDKDALTGYFSQYGVLMLVLEPDGTQTELRVSPDETSARNAFALTPSEREAFFARGARLVGTQTYALAENGYAWAEGESSVQGLSVRESALYTAYLGDQLTFYRRTVGVAADDARAALAAHAKRLVLLGARAGENERAAAGSPFDLLTLTDYEPSAEMAEVEVESASIPVALTPIPAVVRTNYLQLSGTTEPDANVRYTINGKSSSSFKAKEDGTFDVRIPKLETKKTNKLTVQAYKDGAKGIVNARFAVSVAQCPLALSLTEITTSETEVAVYGKTLPDAKVTTERKQKTTNIPVAEDGTFTISAALTKSGVNKYVVSATMDGYKRQEITLSLTLNSDAARFSLADYAANPAAFAGRNETVSGTVLALGAVEGAPCFLLDAGAPLLVFAGDLLNVSLGGNVEAEVSLTGDARAFDSVFAAGTYPAASAASVQTR